MRKRREDPAPEYEHLHPQVRRLAALDNASRITQLHRDLWIPYPRAREIEAALVDLLEHPRSARMPNALIVGERGNGKSSIAQHFARRFGGRDEKALDRRALPVLLIESPSAPLEARIYQQILRDLFSPFHPKSPVAQLRYQVERTLTEIGTRMLMLDEMHHLMDGNAVQQRQCLNSLKSLANTLGVAIVGFGTERAEHVISTDEQLANRFEVLDLPGWTYNHEWRELLTSFERCLPLRRPSHLDGPALASLLHTKSGGWLGDLVQLLRRAGKQAITSGSECITWDIVNHIRIRRPGDRQ